MFDAVVFAGGGCRCFWQAGFWQTAAPRLSLQPATFGAVSAGSAFACAAAAGIIDRVVDDFLTRADRNRKNIYPERWLAGERVFPHEQIYRSSVLATIDREVMRRLHTGPDVRVLLAYPPRQVGAKARILAGLAAYQLDLWVRQTVHVEWPRKLGFRPEVVSVRSCQTPEELAELILHSSCTPPLTPLYRRKRRIVIDGGIIDAVPVEAVPESARRTLVLVTRPYRPDRIPRVEHRTYVQPSRPIPVSKWDYADPKAIQETYDLGRRDGEVFAARAATQSSIRCHQ